MFLDKRHDFVFLGIFLFVALYFHPLLDESAPQARGAYLFSLGMVAFLWYYSHPDNQNQLEMQRIESAGVLQQQLRNKIASVQADVASQVARRAAMRSEELTRSYDEKVAALGEREAASRRKAAETERGWAEFTAARSAWTLERTSDEAALQRWEEGLRTREKAAQADARQASEDRTANEEIERRMAELITRLDGHIAISGPDGEAQQALNGDRKLADAAAQMRQS